MLEENDNEKSKRLKQLFDEMDGIEELSVGQMISTHGQRNG